jgi:hypothetical protein
MKLTINVTTDDIAAGERGSCRNCPVALAALRVLPGRSEVRVRPRELSVAALGPAFAGGSRHFTADLPATAWVWISDFDDGEPVLPFRFEVKLFDDAAEAAP